MNLNIVIIVQYLIELLRRATDKMMLLTLKKNVIFKFYCFSILCAALNGKFINKLLEFQDNFIIFIAEAAEPFFPISSYLLKALALFSTEILSLGNNFGRIELDVTFWCIRP